MEFLAVTGFSALYLAVLVLPGLALSRLCEVRDVNLPVFSVALSYALFLLLFAACLQLEISATAFQAGLATLALVSSVYLLLRKQFCRPWLTPILIISGISFSYQVFVGAYVEVPADIYAHLERMQAASRLIADNSLGAKREWLDVIQQKTNAHYFLAASLNDLFSVSSRRVVESLDFLNRSLFLVAVFYFAKSISAESKSSILIASCCVVLTALHFGTNIFAFVRYYSLAPTILCLIMYFSACLGALEVLKSDTHAKQRLIYILLISCLLLACLISHVQEALFIAVTVSIMCFLTIAKHLFGFEKLGFAAKSLAIAGSVLSIVGFVLIYLYSQDNLQRAPNAHHRLWVLGPEWWIFPKLTILNLKFQFIETITYWGCFVYLLFFINIKKFSNTFVLAAMISPLFTFLNPFFVDLFLRHYNSTTLWRLCYILPIYLVAATLLVHYYRQLFETRSNLKRLNSAFVISLLLTLLIPIQQVFSTPIFPRYASLAPSDDRLDHTRYEGLLDYLDSIQQSKNVITDPMMGYMISGLTKHTSHRRKSFRSSSFRHFTFEDYSNFPLTKYKGSLLVTNTPPRVRSKIGKISRHWQSWDWSATRNYYPPALFEHLESHPELFVLKHQDQHVSVYEIMPR